MKYLTMDSLIKGVRQGDPEAITLMKELAGAIEEGGRLATIRMLHSLSARLFLIGLEMAQSPSKFVN
jgi:hypothetical protein